MVGGAMRTLDDARHRRGLSFFKRKGSNWINRDWRLVILESVTPARMMRWLKKVILKRGACGFRTVASRIVFEQTGSFIAGSFALLSAK